MASYIGIKIAPEGGRDDAGSIALPADYPPEQNLSLSPVIREHDHPPSYRSLSRRMFMMILGRKRSALLGDDFMAAAHAAINP